MTEMRRSSSGSTAVLKPHLDKINPDSGPVTGGQKVTLTGTGLLGVIRVLFGAEEATEINVVDSNRVTCVTPANNRGPCKVYVKNSANDDSNQLSYTFA